MASNLRFGKFEWRPGQRQLLADGRPLLIGSRGFDLLSVLLSNRARVLGKGELLDLAWPGVVVEENNLSVQVSALRKLLGEQAIVTVTGRGYRWALDVTEAPESMPTALPPRRPSLAVLPFANIGGIGADEYLADGLAEDIVAGLSRSRWLFVVSHTATLCFRDDRRGPTDIARQLGVSYVVHGGVRRAGPALRVSVALLDARDGETLWTERHDRPVDDLFAVQDEITRRIVATVEPVFLQREELQASRRDVCSVEHWDLLMRARWHYWRSSPKHSQEAKRLLLQALTLQPDDVAALSLLAFSLATDTWSGWAENPKAAAIEAHRLAVRAVALDNSDAFAHFTLGVTLLGFGQVDRAIAEHRRALALYPHFAAASAELGRLLAFSGQPAEAERLIRQAMAESPAEPRMSLWLFGLAIACFVDARLPEAIEHAAMAISHRPDWFFNHYLMAACLSECGELVAARESLAEGVRLLPTFNMAALRIGHPFTDAVHHDRYVASLRRVGWTG
jgi:TolB-like protein